jgi:hypothetical protein
MRGKLPTSALLERVEAHIDRLDRALKESEDLLRSVKRIDREDWIRQLHDRLAAYAAPAIVDQADLANSQP